MTFDIDLLTDDLNIKRVYKLIMYLLPTKFEAFWAKCSWLISHTLYWRTAWHLTLTFDLLTWLWIGIIYSYRTIYRLKVWRLYTVLLEWAQVLIAGGFPTLRGSKDPYPVAPERVKKEIFNYCIHCGQSITACSVCLMFATVCLLKK